jgi:hypothetical protein
MVHYFQENKRKISECQISYFFIYVVLQYQLVFTVNCGLYSPRTSSFFFMRKFLTSFLAGLLLLILGAAGGAAGMYWFLGGTNPALSSSPQQAAEASRLATVEDSLSTLTQMLSDLSAQQSSAPQVSVPVTPTETENAATTTPPENNDVDTTLDEMAQLLQQMNQRMNTAEDLLNDEIEVVKTETTPTEEEPMQQAAPQDPTKEPFTTPKPSTMDLNPADFTADDTSSTLTFESSKDVATFVQTKGQSLTLVDSNADLTMLQYFVQDTQAFDSSATAIQYWLRFDRSTTGEYKLTWSRDRFQCSQDADWQTVQC